jgi:hypothetical protein
MCLFPLKNLLTCQLNWQLNSILDAFKVKIVKLVKRGRGRSRENAKFRVNCKTAFCSIFLGVML